MAREQWEANEQLQASEATAILGNMRAAHQRALLDLIKGERQGAAAAMLGQVAQGLGQLCDGAPAAAQWQAFARLAQALGAAEGKLDAGSAGLLRQVDAALRALALGWPDSLHAPAAPELADRLLEAAGRYARAHRPVRGPRAAMKPPAPAPAQPEAHDEPPADRFAAQVEEALRSIGECLPAWRRWPQEPGPLKALRQAFRDLKASAEQADADDIAAELAWAIDNLLNRVAERTVAPSEPLFALVERAASLLAGLQAGIEPDRGRLAMIVEDADFLASGGSLDAQPEEEPEEPAELLAEVEASDALRTRAEQCLAEAAAGLRGLAAALEQAPPALGGPRPASEGAASEEAFSGASASLSKLPALLSQIEQAQQLLNQQSRVEAQLKEGLLKARKDS